MNISVHEMTAHQFKNSLTGLKNILIIAKQWAEPKKIDMSVFFQARLAPDMFPLGSQIRIACDNAKAVCARLSLQTAPVFEDKEVTLDDFLARIDKTIDYISSFNAEMFKEFENAKVEFSWYPGHFLTGKDYLVQFALPNFYFHLTAAYAIIRHQGVDLGKGDYMNQVHFQKK